MDFFASKLIHGDEEKAKPFNALNEPIFMTSTFTFKNLEQAEKTFNFETDDYVYTRGNNPTLRVLEKKMALLEEGADAVAFASGMAAISSTLFSLLKPGDEIIGHKVLYGSSYKFIKNFLTGYGVKSRFLDLRDLEALKRAIQAETKVIFLETPANPTLDIIDIQAIAQLCHEKRIKLVVDNTFASPYLQRPLTKGADIVVHSATKYLSGHGDLLAGIVVAKDQDYIHHLKFNYLTELGGVLSPFNAWLLLRGLKTLAVRMKQHTDNALKVARFLNKHPRIKKVYYPGLAEFPAYDLASKQMEAYGAIISFEYQGSFEEARHMLDSLKMIKLAVSLGDTETLIEYPFAMTHRDYSREELAEYGLSETLIRLSIGLEDYRDIIKDLEQALNKS